MIIIRELTLDSARDLIRAGFCWPIDELYPSTIQRFLATNRVKPFANRLVAYDDQKKQAIGFMCLMEDNPSIFNIKFVFVDPDFRNKGIASQMLDFAFKFAKRKGARKIYLDVEDENRNAAQLYENLGFKVIGTKLVGQGSLMENPRLRVFYQTLKGQGYFSRPKSNNQFSSLNLKSKKDKDLLFDIYCKYIDEKTVRFFELDSNIIVNGYSQIWKKYCIKDAIVDTSHKSYALIFNPLLFSYANIEINGSSNEVFQILNNLNDILNRKGMSYIHITLFNSPDNPSCDWFDQKGFEIFHFKTMGIELK
jgi:GNAT superfamily N-acetyltransferase